MDIQNKYGAKIRCIQCYDNSSYDMLFIPGGPGFDSEYMISLSTIIVANTSRYLIDLPNKDFDKWTEILLQTIKQFNNPILICHSFGAMLVLLIPELDGIIKKLVILNSSPVLWFDPTKLTREVRCFLDRPSYKSMQSALVASGQLYFDKRNVSDGSFFLSKLKFDYEPAKWWLDRIIRYGYNAKWVPTIPTLVVCGEYDNVTYLSLWYVNGKFIKQNIKMTLVSNAGHFSWLENPSQVAHVVNSFLKS